MIQKFRGRFGRTAMRRRLEQLSLAWHKERTRWFKWWQPFQKTYAQFGEDLIVTSILAQLEINHPTYLDIGAHDAFEGSNTALLYQRGSRGVCVEPDPLLWKTLVRQRKGDICLNVGIGVGDGAEADFYLMSHKGLNTFLKEEAEKSQRYGYRLEKILQVPLVSCNELMEKYFSPYPNFLSLDVEGLDLAVLQTLDFNRFHPEVVCVETIEFTQDNTGRKVTEILELMLAHRYFVYADTYLNTIFVERRAWERRPSITRARSNEVS